jgi:hypothetical protein
MNSHAIIVNKEFARFQVVTETSMKFVFWDVAPCSHVEVDDVSEAIIHRPDD